MKELNIRRLTVIVYLALFLSLFYVTLVTYYLSSGNYISILFWLCEFGYLEVAIGYAVILLLLMFIKNKKVLRIIVFVLLWIVVLFCVENIIPIGFGLVCATHWHWVDRQLFISYIPPFFIKLLFFIYYKYKEKQEYKKKKIKSETN